MYISTVCESKSGEAGLGSCPVHVVQHLWLLRDPNVGLSDGAALCMLLGSCITVPLSMMQDVYCSHNDANASSGVVVQYALPCDGNLAYGQVGRSGQLDYY